MKFNFCFRIILYITKALLQKIKERDEDALEKTVKAYLRYVVSLATQGIGLLNLIEIANSGLIDTTKELNYSQNDRFIVFAVNFMRNRIEKALEEKK